MVAQVLVIILLAASANCLSGNEDDQDRRFDERIEFDRHVEVREVIQRRGGRRFDHDQIVNTNSGVPETRLNFHPFLELLDKLTDSGKMTDCGPSKLDITWTPEVVSKSGSVTVSMNAEAATELSTATISGTATWNDMVTIPIRQVETCQTLQQSYPKLSCPIKKGDKYQGSTTINLSNFEQLRPGTIKLDIKVNNENNEQFACLRGSIQIQN